MSLKHYLTIFNWEVLLDQCNPVAEKYYLFCNIRPAKSINGALLALIDCLIASSDSFAWVMVGHYL